MSRTTRLFDLLQILRRHRRPVSGGALASELGVSLRTVYRDISALQAMGAEVEGEPGLGYVMRPGFTLPPLMFSEEEIEALALGLKWVGRRGDNQLAHAARDALAKLASVMPADLRYRLDNSPLMVGPGWDRPQTVDLALLRQAIHNEHRLTIAYRDEQGRRSERTIWPFAHPVGGRYPRRRHALLKEWKENMLTESVSCVSYTPVTLSNTETKDMNPEIVFYTNPFSRGGIVHWMLEEIGAPYRIEVIEFGPAMKSPEYLAINPMGKVPAIRHGDTIVTECAAICAYLADAFPEAGLAPAPADRGDYYRWLFFGAGPLEAAVSFKDIGFEPTTEQQSRYGHGSYESVMTTLAGALRGRRYIAGDSFTAADVYIGSHLGWGMQFGTIEKRPEFEAYWNGLKDRSANKRSEAFIEQASAQQAWKEA